MSQRLCRYGCGVELGQFDSKQNKYLESDNKTLHTRERCESLKENDNQKQGPNGHNHELSLELVLKKLQSIGITLDLDVLRNATNGALK
jgi:hypothetical protein